MVITLELGAVLLNAYTLVVADAVELSVRNFVAPISL
jgi:hypothetical protein